MVLENGRLILSGPTVEVFSQRRQLSELGLVLPAVTEVMHDLSDKNLPVNTAVYTLQAARLELKKLKGQCRL